jgi:ATP-dependent DNA helicase RecQ
VYDVMRAPEAARAGMKAADIAARAGLGERRARVILAWLADAGIVERRRGSFVRARGFASTEELGQFQRAYEERSALDRQRLEAMMRYAEHTTCRVRYLRAYFGEEEGEDCGHCDNCRDRPATAIPARERAEEAHAAPKVAPIEVAPPPPAPFAAGERVHHAQFGDGEVVRTAEDKVTVAFAEGGERVVQAGYLARAA